MMTCTPATGSVGGLTTDYCVRSLSVFFPAYNDAPALPQLVERCFEILDGSVPDFEVIVVNDGSADDTALVLQQMQKRFGPRLVVVDHGSNKGYGAALRSGFQSATKDWVFYTDGDGQYNLDDLPALLREATPSIGFVNGYKVTRSDSWYRVWIGRIYNTVIRKAFSVSIRDVDCDFRLIRRSLVEGCEFRSTSGSVCLELVKHIESTGAAHAEMSVRHLPRRHGRSQFFRPRSLMTTFQQLARLYWEQVAAPRLRRLV